MIRMTPKTRRKTEFYRLLSYRQSFVKSIGVFPAGRGTSFKIRPVLRELTDEEELCLVQWAKSLVKVGFPATDSDLLDQVQRLLIKDRRKNPFENSRPTRGWLQHLKKNPELTHRTPEALQKKKRCLRDLNK